jgi:hypothetical protein
VSRQYLARLAREGELARARRAEQEAAGKEQTPFADNYIEAVRSGKCGHYWQVSRREVERFAALRIAPTAVVGYDLTFSCPKSVSVLWATAKPTEQAEILDSVAAAVGAGVAYLEAHAAYVQGSSQPASGLVGASFLHATSRALEPQLHHHVVVANMTERADGTVLALDGRPLFSHAMTAGHRIGDRSGLADDRYRGQPVGGRTVAHCPWWLPPPPAAGRTVVEQGTGVILEGGGDCHRPDEPGHRYRGRAVGVAPVTQLPISDQIGGRSTPGTPPVLRMALPRA